jgi:DNA mismatch repair protein PMS2
VIDRVLCSRETPLIPCAQRGTTVSLVGLFKPLPVRRKEFERNAKREITKALTMLTGYALVPASASASVSASKSSGSEGSTGVRIKVESISGGKGGYVRIHSGCCG